MLRLETINARVIVSSERVRALREKVRRTFKFELITPRPRDDRHSMALVFFKTCHANHLPFVQQVLGRCAVQLAATLEKKRARAGREVAVPAPSGPPPVATSARALKELRAAVEKVRARL